MRSEARVRRLSERMWQAAKVNDGKISPGAALTWHQALEWVLNNAPDIEDKLKQQGLL